MVTLQLKPDPDLREIYEEHQHFHEGDSGLDIYTPETITVPGGAISYKIPLGIRCEMIKTPEGEVDLLTPPEYVSYWLMPRSSMGSKTPLRLANSMGLVDAGYRGEIMAVVDNMESEWPFTVEAGTRLFQLVAMDGSPIHLEVVDRLSETARGEGGFGSTGK